MNILNTSKKFLKAGVCAIMLITAGQAQAQPGYGRRQH